METFVESSNGTISIDPETGKVLDIDRGTFCEDSLMEYEGATFDLEEFNTYWGYPKGDRQDSYDILDLGFTMANGSYEPACNEHRENTKIARED